MTSPFPPGSIEAVIALAESGRCRALIARDFAALHALLSPDLLYVHSTGRLDDKASFVDNVKARVRYHSIEAEDVHIEASGNLALWTGTVHAEVSVPLDASAMKLRSHVTLAWRLEAASWRLTLFQATRLADAPSG